MYRTRRYGTEDDQRPAKNDTNATTPNAKIKMSANEYGIAKATGLLLNERNARKKSPAVKNRLRYLMTLSSVVKGVLFPSFLHSQTSQTKEITPVKKSIGKDICPVATTS